MKTHTSTPTQAQEPIASASGPTITLLRIHSAFEYNLLCKLSRLDSGEPTAHCAEDHYTKFWDHGDNPYYPVARQATNIGYFEGEEITLEDDEIAEAEAILAQYEKEKE